MTVTNHKEDVLQEMIEIELIGDNTKAFRAVKETLTRVGIPSQDSNTLFQTAHIFHSQGRYYICHFKQLFELAGKTSTATEFDMERRNRIANLLQEWGLVKLLDDAPFNKERPPMLKIVKHSERDKWILKAKYEIGRKKKPVDTAE